MTEAGIIKLIKKKRRALNTRARYWERLNCPTGDIRLGAGCLTELLKEIKEQNNEDSG